VLVFLIPKVKVWLALLVVLVISLLSLWLFFLGAQPSAGKMRRFTILVDPGHGGVDGGTRDAQGNMEKDINLMVALRLRDQLCQSGLNVVMTRETDTELSPFQPGQRGRHRRDLMERIQKARNEKCLFMVSIHCNWAANQKKRGAITFYSSQSLISKGLAGTVQEELNKLQKTSKKPVGGKYLILNQPEITGILVEVGFLSNQAEAELLRDQVYLEHLALAITKGILKYSQNYLTVPPAYNNYFYLEDREI
jgi:N-acetylmuramoyl-L-alanine amidase